MICFLSHFWSRSEVGVIKLCYPAQRFDPNAGGRARVYEIPGVYKVDYGNLGCNWELFV